MEIEERKKRQSERTGGGEEGRGWCAVQYHYQTQLIIAKYSHYYTVVLDLL
jgi:hypothetical protein